MQNQDRIRHDTATILSIIKYILIIGVSIAAIYFGMKSIRFIAPFFIGLILAQASVTIANSIYRLFYRLKHRGSDNWRRVQLPAGSRMVRFIFVLIMIALLLILVVFLGWIFNQVTYFTSLLPNWIRSSNFSNQLLEMVNNFSGRLGGLVNQDVISMIENALNTLQTRLMGSIPGIITGVVSALGNFAKNLPMIFLVIIVTIMSGYFFISDSGKLYRRARQLIPDRNFVKSSFAMINRLANTLFRIIGGYLTIFVLTFVQCWIGFLLIRLPNPALWAGIAAFIDFLPVLGISATLIPIAIYLFVTAAPWQGVAALVMLAVLTVTRRLIEPPILGTAMRLHPLMTIFSMIVGIVIWGLGGVLLGPMVFVFLREILTTFQLREKISPAIAELLQRLNLKTTSKSSANNSTATASEAAGSDTPAT